MKQLTKALVILVRCLAVLVVLFWIVGTVWVGVWMAADLSRAVATSVKLMPEGTGIVYLMVWFLVSIVAAGALVLRWLLSVVIGTWKREEEGDESSGK